MLEKSAVASADPYGPVPDAAPRWRDWGIVGLLTLGFIVWALLREEQLTPVGETTRPVAITAGAVMLMLALMAVAFREMQGYGLVLTLLPPEKRGLGFALFGMTATFAPAIGPTTVAGIVSAANTRPRASGELFVARATRKTSAT